MFLLPELDLKDFFGNKETCDVTLKVKDKEYKAHKSVLIARSKVFATTFKRDPFEKRTRVIIINHCDPDCIQQLLDYMYRGEIEELSIRSAFNLYSTSNLFSVEEGKAFCVEYMKRCLTVENIFEIAEFAKKYAEKQLKKVVQAFFVENRTNIALTHELRGNNLRLYREMGRRHLRSLLSPNDRREMMRMRFEHEFQRNEEMEI